MSTPMQVQQQSHHGQVPQQQQLQQPHQTIYIQTVPATYSRKENFNGRLAVVFGAIIIVLHSVAIVLNIVGTTFQSGRVYDWVGNVAMVMLPAAWGALFIYLAGAFAIAAGKTKSRCLVITHVVFSVIASVFIFMFFCGAAGCVVIDADYMKGYGVTSKDQGSLTMSVLMLICAVVEFVIMVWAAVLGYRVTCCEKSDPNPGGEAIAPTQIVHIVPGTSYPSNDVYATGGAAVNPAFVASDEKQGPPPQYTQ